MTSKLQVTVPKAIADEYRIRPGDDVLWVSAGDVIRVVPPGRKSKLRSKRARLKLFVAASDRQREREASRKRSRKKAGRRGWVREDLYDRAKPR